MATHIINIQLNSPFSPEDYNNLIRDLSNLKIYSVTNNLHEAWFDLPKGVFRTDFFISKSHILSTCKSVLSNLGKTNIGRRNFEIIIFEVFDTGILMDLKINTDDSRIPVN